MSPTALQLVLGEEEFLVERAVEAIVAEVRAVDPTAELRRIRAGETTPADLVESLSPSLFAEGRVVVLLAAHEAGKDLTAAVLEVAADLAEGMVLVVQHAGGARNKALVDALRKAKPTVTTCDRVTRLRGAGGVRARRGAARGRRASPQAAVPVLIEAVGSDLRELAAATAQLVADTGGTVDESAVRRYYRGRAESSGFAVADKVVVGDRAGALEALRWAAGAGRAVRADRRRVGRCGAHPRAGRRRGPGRSQPARGLAGHAAVEDPQGPAAGAALEPGARWPIAFAVAAEVNADVKGAAADVDYALERAVLRICAARGRAAAVANAKKPRTPTGSVASAMRLRRRS